MPQANFGQVYATRERLMGRIGQACRKRGIQQVQLVRRDPAPRERIALAIAP